MFGFVSHRKYSADHCVRLLANSADLSPFAYKSSPVTSKKSYMQTFFAEFVA